MTSWISESIDLLSLVASTVFSEPFIYIFGLFILIVVCKIFRLLGGV